MLRDTDTFTWSSVVKKQTGGIFRRMVFPNKRINTFLKNRKKVEIRALGKIYQIFRNLTGFCAAHVTNLYWVSGRVGGCHQLLSRVLNSPSLDEEMRVVGRGVGGNEERQTCDYHPWKIWELQAYYTFLSPLPSFSSRFLSFFPPNPLPLPPPSPPSSPPSSTHARTRICKWFVVVLQWLNLGLGAQTH